MLSSNNPVDDSRSPKKNPTPASVGVESESGATRKPWKPIVGSQRCHATRTATRAV